MSPPRWTTLLIGGLVLALVIYLVLIPAGFALLEHFRPPRTSRLLEELTFAEQIRLRSAEVFTAFWFFALGATVGSFLNVVAYRLPRGISLVRRGSQCPACATPIAAGDNIPIWGWLRLRGRCRACGIAISPRYPLVEAVTAAGFLLLYFVELLSGGANIPVREPNHYAGVVWIIFYTKWDLIRLYLFHVFVLSALFSWALIAWDRQRVPLRSVCVTLVIAVTLPLIWPELLPVAALPKGLLASWLTPRFSALLTATVGGLLGWLMGILSQFLLRQTADDDRTAGLPAALTLVGVGFGWQAVLAVALLTFGLRLAGAATWRRILRRCHWPLLADLTVATLVHLLVWRPATTHLFPWFPGPRPTVLGLAAAACALAALIVALRWLEPLPLAARDAPPDAADESLPPPESPPCQTAPNNSIA